MTEKTPSGGPSGAASLIAASAILALVAFAVMCLSTASADERILNRMVQAEEAWYEADARATAIYNQIRSGKIPESVSETGDSYRYEVKIDGDRSIDVKIGPDGEILSWRTVRNRPWIPNDSIEVWNGE